MIAPTRLISSVVIALSCWTFGCNSSTVDSAKPMVGSSSANANNSTNKESPKEKPHASFYTVATYDKTVDPHVDLEKTIARAQAENKRVILLVGGDWCVWCRRLADYMSTNAAVCAHLEKNFLVMKVTFPGDHADEFLSKYPKIEAYPHLFVLDSNGDFLHSQGTAELEKGNGYDDEVVMAFLNRWTR